MSRTVSIEKNSAVLTVSTAGGEAVSFRMNGREMLWSGDPAVWSHHSPFLFPICGASRDGVIEINGRTFPMTKHGFAEDSEWAVTSQTDDTVTLTLPVTDRTRSMYPFDFGFSVTYTVWQDGYEVRILTANHGSGMMPYCLGAHPGFALPLDKQKRFEDYALVFPLEEKAETVRVISGGYVDGILPLRELENGRRLPLTHAMIDAYDTILMHDLRSGYVDLAASDGHGVRLTFEGFSVLGIWTAAGVNAPYICLEPWNGLPYGTGENNVLAEKPYAVCLKPGEEREIGYSIRAI